MPLKIGQRQFTKEQTIFLGVAAGIVLIFLLIVVGALPGKRGANPEVDLVVWGAGDKSVVWKGTIARFGKSYPDVNIEYVSVSKTNYESDLLNALAAGRGPDVFMFHSKWLTEHGDKIVPAPTEKMTPLTFAGFFPRVAEQDFVRDGRIYALPLSVDTLAIAYNRDIYDKNQIVFPPKTWDEFQKAVLKITRLEDGVIVESAASIGITSQNIPNASDILSMLILQHGAPIVDAEFNGVDFGRDSEDALKLYTQFGDPENTYYTWNDEFNTSNKSFANEEVALVFAYPDDVTEIREENPFLDFDVRAVPQLNLTDPVAFASYWGLAVSTRSANPNTAWDFVVFATTDSASAQDYITKTGRSPALRFLINNYLNNPDIGVFAGQALIARSWRQADDTAVEEIFNDMIESVLSGERSPRRALGDAKAKLGQLMRRN